MEHAVRCRKCQRSYVVDLQNVLVAPRLSIASKSNEAKYPQLKGKDVFRDKEYGHLCAREEYTLYLKTRLLSCPRCFLRVHLPIKFPKALWQKWSETPEGQAVDERFLKLMVSKDKFMSVFADTPTICPKCDKAMLWHLSFTECKLCGSHSVQFEDSPEEL